MKKYAALLLAALLALAPAPFGGRALADTAGTSAAESSGEDSAEADAVASEEELSSRKEVGREGMEPVTADQLENGSWPIEVDTDTSMFRVADAVLMVDNGTMTAKLTLGGKGYEKLYMGTAEEAAAAADADCAFYEENADSSFAYTVEVPVLNAEVDCAAWSIRKEKWYGHKIVFEADTLPEGALKQVSEAWKEVDPVIITPEQGNYTMNVTLSGGSGKASVEFFFFILRQFCHCIRQARGLTHQVTVSGQGSKRRKLRSPVMKTHVGPCSGLVMGQVNDIIVLIFHG